MNSLHSSSSIDHHVSIDRSLTQHPQPKPTFRIMSEEELKVSRQTSKILEKKFKEDHNPSTHVKLLKNRLKELEHCFQSKKNSEDQLLKNQESVKRKHEKEVESLREEITQKKHKIEELENSCGDYTEEVYTKLEERFFEVVQDLAAAHKNLAKINDQNHIHSNAINFLEQKLTAAEEQKSELAAQITHIEELFEREIAVRLEKERECEELKKTVEAYQKLLGSIQVNLEMQANTLKETLHNQVPPQSIVVSSSTSTLDSLS